MLYSIFGGPDLISATAFRNLKMHCLAHMPASSLFKKTLRCLMELNTEVPCFCQIRQPNEHDSDARDGHHHIFCSPCAGFGNGCSSLSSMSKAQVNERSGELIFLGSRSGDHISLVSWTSTGASQTSAQVSFSTDPRAELRSWDDGDYEDVCHAMSRFSLAQ